MPKPTDEAIRTVGILFDQTHFRERDALVAELEKAGIARGNISVLVFQDTIGKGEAIGAPSFSYNDFKWTAQIDNPDIKAFTRTHFDLLINY